MNKVRQLVTVSSACAASALLFFFGTVSCTADDSNQVQNWLVTISMQTYSPYLDYPNSRIKSLTTATVSFSQPANDSATQYKEFYFAPGRIIGSRRDSELGVVSGTAGVIKVNCTDSSQSYAAADTVARMWLDLFLERCPTKTVIVPKDFFNTIITAFCSQGFQIAPPIASRKSASFDASVMLTIVSDPPGYSQDVML